MEFYKDIDDVPPPPPPPPGLPRSKGWERDASITRLCDALSGLVEVAAELLREMAKAELEDRVSQRAQQAANHERMEQIRREGTNRR